jgi:hypothetical protein
MKKMVEETNARGATPILISRTARNIWRDGPRNWRARKTTPGKIETVR